MKRFFLIMSGLFMVSLAVTVALRMTSDAMAVIIGILLGMLATVPTSLVMFYMIRQRDHQPADPRTHQAGHYPPVVVVNSPPYHHGYGAAPGFGSSPALLPAPGGERSFKIIGQEASSADIPGETFSINAIWDEIT